MSGETTPTEADPSDLLVGWLETPIDGLCQSTTVKKTFAVEEIETVGQLLDVYEGWEPGTRDPLTLPPLNLSEFQAADVHTWLADSLPDGLAAERALPWLADAEPAAEPVVVDGEPGPADPTDLPAWDAETARLTAEMEAENVRLEAVWEDLHGEASLAKKAFETHRDKMRTFIRERTTQRGKRPEPTLFDAGNRTGDAAAPTEDKLFELSQLYPLDFAHWREFGLTEKDVEKLNAGETKHHGTIPLRTLGDVARYTKPTADGFERRLTDLKGIGPGAFERWEAANLAFWAAWPNGKAVQFAAEIGFDLGAVADACATGVGSGTGGEGGDGDAEAGPSAAPAPEQPPQRLKRNERTGELETVGDDRPKGKKRGKREAA